VAVIQLSVATGDLLLKFHSDITFVHVAVEMIRNVLEYMNVDDPTNVLLVSRELLKNAVVHGNQNNRDKEVFYWLSRIGQDRFKLEVEDGGPGVKAANNETAVKNVEKLLSGDDIQGRGFTIIRSLSEQVFFNERGNKITVVLDA
jgi:anti-sigma regulatory factor (Ser/Thr protein kinase)